MFVKKLKNAFAPARVLCRLFAAWFAFASLILLLNGEDFISLSYAQDIFLGVLLLGILGFFALFSCLAFFCKDLPVDSWVLLLFSFACCCYWSVACENKENAFLTVLAVIVVFSMVVVTFIRQNQPLLSSLSLGKRSTAFLVGVFGVISCGIIIVITVLRYRTFSSPNFDFGLFCNMFHNMKETGLPYVTSERDQLLSHFAIHISPIYYLLLPFYFVFPYPETLQVGQAIVLAAGIVPTVLLAKHFGLSNKLTVFVAGLYAFYPALSAGCFYDLHENCFLPVCLLFTFYFFEKKKYLPMYVSAALVLMVKEDAAIYLLVFAVFILLSEKNVLHGSILAVLSLGYFFLATYLLREFGEGVMTGRFQNLILDKETGLFGAIKTVLLNPGYALAQLFTTSKNTWEKVAYVLQMLLPLGFLPFCTKKPSRWLLLAPILINLLSYYVYQYDIGFQYHFGITAFLVYATLKNLPELTPPTKRTLLGIAAAACCCLYLTTVIPTQHYYVDRYVKNRDSYQRMEAFLDTVPEDASVCCSSFLLAHLADRDEIYEARYHKNAPDVDYVVLDVRHPESEAIKNAYLQQGYTYHSHCEDLILVLQAPDR